MNYLILLVIFFFADFAFVAIFRRMGEGRFDVIADSEYTYKFDTDLGRFAIDRSEKSLTYESKNGDGFILLNYIECIDFDEAHSYALFQELFFGFDFTDLFRSYADTTIYHSIFLLTKDGKLVPLFVASQYHQREFLLGWYIQWQQSVLERFNLFTNAEQHSMKVFDDLRRAFEISDVTNHRIDKGAS